MSQERTLSVQWRKRMEHVTTGGCQTRSRAFDAWPFTVVADAQLGARIRDVDGHSYVDLFNANCAVTLGHGHPVVMEAAVQQMARGVLYSLPHRLEGEASEKFLQTLGWAESVRWVKTGSEATSAAIRIARMATGRDGIVVVKDCYHGWHDWFTVIRDEHPGVPPEMDEGVRTFVWGSDDFPDDWYYLTGEGEWPRLPAALILEPSPDRHPMQAEVVARMAAQARAAGALVIWDEMISGFRYATEGAGPKMGSTPDLACYGKAIAQGFPLACVVGSRDLMKHATVISGTYGGEAVSLAACRAVCGIYRQTNVPDQLATLGRVISVWLRDAAKAAGVAIEVAGHEQRPMLTFAEEPQRSLRLFSRELQDAGVILHPSGGINPSLALEERDLNIVQDAIWAGMRAVNRAHHRGWPQVAGPAEAWAPRT